MFEDFFHFTTNTGLLQNDHITEFEIAHVLNVTRIANCCAQLKDGLAPVWQTGASSNPARLKDFFGQLVEYFYKKV